MEVSRVGSEFDTWDMCSDERAVDKAGIHRYASVSKDRRLEKDDQIRYVLQVVRWTLLNAGELIFTRITSVPFFTVLGLEV